MENPHVFQISEEYCSHSIHVYHVWYIYLGLPLKNIKQLQVNIPVPWMVWGSYDLCVFFSSVIVCAISPAPQIRNYDSKIIWLVVFNIFFLFHPDPWGNDPI